MSELTERLRSKANDKSYKAKPFNLMMDAADALEVKEARIETLENALREMVYETTHLSPMEPDGSHKCKISGSALEKSRNALTPSLPK